MDTEREKVINELLAVLSKDCSGRRDLANCKDVVKSFCGTDQLLILKLFCNETRLFVEEVEPPGHSIYQQEIWRTKRGKEQKNDSRLSLALTCLLFVANSKCWPHNTKEPKEKEREVRDLFDVICYIYQSEEEKSLCIFLDSLIGLILNAGSKNIAIFPDFECLYLTVWIYVCFIRRNPDNQVNIIDILLEVNTQLTPNEFAKHLICLCPGRNPNDINCSFIVEKCKNFFKEWNCLLNIFTNFLFDIPYFENISEEEDSMNVSIISCYANAIYRFVLNDKKNAWEFDDFLQESLTSDILPCLFSQQRTMSDVLSQVEKASNATDFEKILKEATVVNFVTNPSPRASVETINDELQNLLAGKNQFVEDKCMGVVVECGDVVQQAMCFQSNIEILKTKCYVTSLESKRELKNLINDSGVRIEQLKNISNLRGKGIYGIYIDVHLPYGFEKHAEEYIENSLQLSPVMVLIYIFSKIWQKWKTINKSANTTDESRRGKIWRTVKDFIAYVMPGNCELDESFIRDSLTATKDLFSKSGTQNAFYREMEKIEQHGTKEWLLTEQPLPSHNDKWKKMNNAFGKNWIWFTDTAKYHSAMGYKVIRKVEGNDGGSHFPPLFKETVSSWIEAIWSEILIAVKSGKAVVVTARREHGRFVWNSLNEKQKKEKVSNITIKEPGKKAATVTLQCGDIVLLFPFFERVLFGCNADEKIHFISVSVPMDSDDLERLSGRTFCNASKRTYRFILNCLHLPVDLWKYPQGFCWKFDRKVGQRRDLEDAESAPGDYLPDQLKYCFNSYISWRSNAKEANLLPFLRNAIDATDRAKNEKMFENHDFNTVAKNFSDIFKKLDSWAAFSSRLRGHIPLLILRPSKSEMYWNIYSGDTFLSKEKHFANVTTFNDIVNTAVNARHVRQMERKEDETIETVVHYNGDPEDNAKGQTVVILNRIGFDVEFANDDNVSKLTAIDGEFKFIRRAAHLPMRHLDQVTRHKEAVIYQQLVGSDNVMGTLKKLVEQADQLKAITNRHEYILNSVDPGNLVISPLNRIIFNSPFDLNSEVKMAIKNESDEIIAWKISVNDTNRLSITDVHGVLYPNQNKQIVVTLRIPTESEEDKITVIWTTVPRGQDCKEFDKRWGTQDGEKKEAECKREIAIEYN